MPIDMPTSPGFTDCEWGLETNTQTFESPLTRAVQRVKLGGDRWTATYALPRMNKAQAAPWIAFFLQCQGRFNAFHAFDPDRKTPRGIATGTPLVNGGSQTGSTLTIDGCAANVAGWLLAGDYFGVNGELHQLTSPANTNGSGQTTLYFQPPLRTSPADNAALTLVKPTCPMILSDDVQGKWRCDRNGVYEAKTFSAMEVF